MKPLYDTIGTTYTATRRADPTIASRIARSLSLRECGDAPYLDVGCGTGNYTCALAAIGGRWHGVDVSRTMLDKAAAKSSRIEWRMASALALPFADATFDGAVCTLAIHHFPEIRAPFREVHRVMSSGCFVLFTSFPEQMRGYWLCRYFPRMMERAMSVMPTRDAVESELRGAGFADVEIVPFEVTNDLQDLFLQSGKHRPEAYFDATYRANISSFAAMSDPDETANGLRQLRAELDDGSFADVAQHYASSSGDYAYVIATKPKST